MTDTKSIRVLRRFPDGSTARLGLAVRRREGWRFIPNVSGRQPSRKDHATWEACLPRWVGYPHACETEIAN